MSKLFWFILKKMKIREDWIPAGVYLVPRYGARMTNLLLKNVIPHLAAVSQ